ncbi:membrane protein insertion efficiency factor YidD [bacterium]|nr:MAG: membrane protein insertion efficiency factor YidD [bacterium]
MTSKKPKNIACWLLLVPIKIYQLTLGRILPPTCRFYPTCSEYAYRAISIHGVFRGALLAVKRITRCHPWNPGGYDPVPPPR